MTRRPLAVFALALSTSLACGTSETPANMEPAPVEAASRADTGAPGPGFADSQKSGRSARPAVARKPMASSPAASNQEARRSRGAKGAPSEPMMDSKEETPEAPKTRAWFPDAFVWEPSIETGDDGVAEVSIRVPDTLTDWRVLGLAHDRTGQQAGALTSFATRLPVHGEVRLPQVLYVGDRFTMPVRVANGTDGALSASVGVLATGALSGGGNTSVALRGNGVGVATMTVEATRAGQGLVRTQIQGGGHRDDLEQAVMVTPIGKPLHTSSRGVLAAVTTLDVPAIDGSTGAERLELVVFPGPLALVQAEIDRYAGGARPVLPGAALQAIHHLEALATRSGATIDPKQLRRLKLLAWQQMLPSVQSASPLQQVALLRAMSPTDLVSGAEAARPRLIQMLQRVQKPDGTWSSLDRSVLQRVLVETASTAMVLPADSTARLKAEGALERQIPNVKDAYTAAVLLGSGLLRGSAAEAPRKLLVESIGRDDDGVPSVVVPDDVVDAWGDTPTHTEMLAWTILALGEAPDTLADRGALAAELMGHWTRGAGFGAGRGDPICLSAVVQAVPGASGATRVSVWSGEEELANGQVDPSQPGVPLVLQLEQTDVEVRLDPPVDGLAFTATRRAWVPWPVEAPLAGVEWAWTSSELRVGEPGEITLTLSGPRGTRFAIEQGFPAGTKVESARQDGNAPAWSEVLEDRARVRTEPLGGTASTLTWVVTPSFAGTFHTLPLQVDVLGHGKVVQPGHTWTVK